MKVVCIINVCVLLFYKGVALEFKASPRIITIVSIINTKNRF
ncbi:hypothetical protein BCLUESOX_318 [bacterium endosymbiont of Bathymodiolus sp. 5 South]|nr:hypothetical protein BCLUESOX_318 [bacterium endosymbiont of Bathymodiolus sp. 5 South]VVH62490.1 hypothetical protein BSPWISOX_436 [uncultured Gammaproteobacteria bacterium]